MKNSLFMELQSLLEQMRIISLFGKSGTGKTSFALHFVGWLMTKNKPYQDQCVWIQASEFFPTRRLAQIFNQNIELSRYIRNNIFITPFKHPFFSYQEQSKYLSKIESRIFPSELKYIVIDNISHHLRFELSRSSSISEKIKLLNKFYESQLLPLVLFCQINSIVLILIHEVSYNPSLERNVPFFYKLYNRMESIEIEFQKDGITGRNILNLRYVDFQKRIQYQIREKGFQWFSMEK